MDDLRDYQEQAINDLRASLARGKRRPVVQMPTGAGKTIMAAAIVRMAREKGHKVIFCVPMISLIDQTVDRFTRNGIWSIGVMQAQHELTDVDQPVQVASIQTLMRREIPDAQIVIIDECHRQFQIYEDWFSLPEWKDVPIIGLSATPWAKGMGKIWDDLIIGTTTQELINKGVLSDFKVFAPAHPDLTGVKTVAGDYEVKGLGNAMNKAPLVADIVTTWLERGENRPTLCFAVDRIHAKHIQKLFEEAKVPTGYVDAFSTLEERKEVQDKFAAGEIKVVCNVGVLTTGVDWDVRCIILARPTKSEILYTQIIGRGLRTAPGKDHCLILDHSDTTLRLGFVTEIHYDKLDDGKKNVQLKRDKERLPKECPKCAFLRPAGTNKCPNCGFVAEPVNKTENVDGQLYELVRGPNGKMLKRPIVTPSSEQQFYSELILYAQMNGYKPGWSFYKFRDKFGKDPGRNLQPVPAADFAPSTLSWIRSRNIARAKAAAARFDKRYPDRQK